MLRLLPIVFCVLFSSSVAEAEIPLVNAECPDNIEVHAEEGGPIYVNGVKAKMQSFNENYYEARRGDVTVSLSITPDGLPSVSYTLRGGADGICKIVEH